ncbi:hypothetical protein BIW11_13026, partial [Tropilaelaps mercedesae]
GRHHIEIDRLEDHIRSAVELLRSSEPVRESVEDEARVVLAMAAEQLDQEDRVKKDQAETERKDSSPRSDAEANEADSVHEELPIGQTTAVPSTVGGVMLDEADSRNASDNGRRGWMSADRQTTAVASQQQPRYVMRRTFNSHTPKRFIYQ